MANRGDQADRNTNNHRLSVQRSRSSRGRTLSSDRVSLGQKREDIIAYGGQEEITTLVHPETSIPSRLPPTLSTIATTEKSQENHTFYKKSATGSGRYPTPKDVEHEAGLATFQSTSGPANQGVLELLHSWKQDIHDGAVTAVVSNLGTPAGGSSGTEGRLIWLHVPEPIPSIDRLKNKFETKLASFVQPFIGITVRSILDRLRILRERKFKLGKFLVPGLIRYTADSSLTGYKDNPCMFLNFPFLALGKFEVQPMKDIGSPHPVRSLLQWRYRLESMEKRDQLQSIKCVKDEYILDAAGFGKDDYHLERIKDEKKIHVPQLWSMSISGDILVTSGPFSQIELCGSYLEMVNVKRSQGLGQQRPSVVRICCQVEGESKVTFLFSTDRCESYYALLDKQYKVETALALRSKEGRKATTYGLIYCESGFKDDERTGEEVTSINWCRILRVHTADFLDLWMQARIPPVQTTVSDDSGEESSTSQVSNGQRDVLAYLNNPPNPASRPGAGSPRDSSPGPGLDAQTRPFMTWTFLVEYTSGQELSERYKVNLWLTKVFRSLVRKHGKNIDESLKAIPGLHQLNSTSQTNFAPIGGSTYDKVLDSCPEADPQDQTPESSMRKACHSLTTSSRDLVAMWVESKIYPADSNTQEATLDTANHPLTQLYWGLVSRVITKAGEGSIELKALYSLCDTLKEAKTAAEKLHQGVCKREFKPGQAQNDELVYSERAFVQPHIIDGFEQLVNMLFKFVKKLNDSTKDKPCQEADVKQIIKKRHDKYNICLQHARENLISDTEDARDQSYLGPIVTPEAITILLLGRLSKGCYREKSVNFVDIYEKIVEHVALKIERHYSRFLLIEINRVQEEIEIILEVLKEQEQFLRAYLFHLDPRNITNHTQRRGTAFHFEQEGVKRIRNDIRERTEDFNELLGRVKSLAQKNLRLVESYQDDNNRKLMVFTVVNIIFLPLSFVAGFFGMNVKDIANTTYTSNHFWAIAAPLTGGIVIISSVMLAWEWLYEILLRFRGKSSI